MSGRRLVGIAAVCLAALAGACGEPADDPGESRSVREATITAEVRSRLVANPELAALPLAVSTRGGVVRVSGTVHDTTQVAAVRSVAARVQGVERVNLNVRVVPPPADSVPPARPPRRPAPAATPDSLPSLEEAG